MVGVLVLAIGALTAAAAVRGPRITGIELDRAALVDRDGSRVVLDLDQPVGRPSSVRVTPATDARVTVAGRQIAIEFPRMLRYDTDYRIRLAGVRGVATGATATVETGFRTADAQVYALVRNPNGEDRIVRRALGGGAATTVYSAKRIQRYAVLPTQLAVVTVDRAGTGAVTLVSIDGARSTDPVTAPAGAIGPLAASGPSGYLAFGVTGGELDSRLLILDPNDGSGVAQAVPGPGGDPLSASSVQWIPGRAALVARRDDGALFLVDAATRKATAIGSAGELRGVVPGTATVVVANPDGGSTIDLVTGRSSPFTLADDGQPAGATRFAPILLDGARRYLDVVATPAADFTQRDFRVVEAGPSGGRVLWKPASADTRIADACLSPNRQYLAVELIPAGAASDDYPEVPGFPAGSTAVIDLASGEATRALPGAFPSWC